MPKETPQRKGIGHFLGLKRVLAVNLAVFAVIGWGFSGEYLRNRSLQKEIDRLQAQAHELEVQNLGLIDISRHFASSQAVEREARLKLGLRRPGEEVVVVQGDDRPPPPAAEAAAAPAAGPPDEPNHRKWWRYFFR